MVRVNLLNPKYLADQHLRAEYLEILMLVIYIKKHPSTEDLPKKYTLGKGHMRFFKNKLKYLKKRHESIKKEMRRRGFKADKSLTRLPKKQYKGWRPSKADKQIIKKRLIARLRLKPKFYRYYKKPKSLPFLMKLIKQA